MDVESIEIGCGGCNTSIGINDNCYCEDCLDKKDDEIKALEKKVGNLESDISSYLSEAESYRDEIRQLRVGIKTS